MPSSSPTRRYPRWRPSALLELLGACSPTSAFPRTESGRAWSYKIEGEPGRGRPGHPSVPVWGREWLGCKSLRRTRSVLRQLLAHHTNSQCFPHRQEGEKSSLSYPFHLGGPGMSYTWMVKGAFSPSSCEERSPRTVSAWEKSSSAFALSAHTAPRAGLPAGSIALRFILHRYLLQRLTSSYKVYHAFVYFSVSVTICQEKKYS